MTNVAICPILREKLVGSGASNRILMVQTDGFAVNAPEKRAEMPLVGTSSQNAAADFRQFLQSFARVSRW